MPSTVQPVSYSSVIGPCPGRVIACKNEVTIIETQIQNDVNLNAEEKVILLMSASVARHSYAYWTMVWRDSSDAWWWLYGIHNSTFITTKGVAAADAIGIIKGAYYGFRYGAALGGFGVAGATVGAVAGAAGSSIEAGLVDYIIGLF